MGIDELLSVTPEEMSLAILERRRVLAKILPDVEKKMGEEADQLAPVVEKLRLKRDAESNKVSELKKIRDDAQKSARILLKQTRDLRNKLEAEGGLKNLEPKWAKEQLEDALAEVEEKIEKKAITLEDERKLIKARKELLKKNQEWLEKRRKNNPEMAEYIASSKEMQKLFTLADKCHNEMLSHVSKSEPIHTEFVEKRIELKNIIRQLERSRALIQQSGNTIDFWEKIVKNGPGNLLSDANNIRQDKKSTIKRKNAELPISSTPQKEGGK